MVLGGMTMSAFAERERTGMNEEGVCQMPTRNDVRLP